MQFKKTNKHWIILTSHITSSSYVHVAIRNLFIICTHNIVDWVVNNNDFYFIIAVQPFGLRTFPSRVTANSSFIPGTAPLWECYKTITVTTTFSSPDPISLLLCLPLPNKYTTYVPTSISVHLTIYLSIYLSIQLSTRKRPPSTTSSHSNLPLYTEYTAAALVTREVRVSVCSQSQCRLYVDCALRQTIGDTQTIRLNIEKR